MSPEIAALLDARTIFDAAALSHRSAVEQLAIAAERWAETRPDRLATQLETYRRTLRLRADASRLVTIAERAARNAGVLCEHCEGVDNHHDIGCERPVDATEQADRLAQRAA